MDLIISEQIRLLEDLQENEDIFDGTLGDWKTKPVLVEVKEGANHIMAKLF